MVYRYADRNVCSAQDISYVPSSPVVLAVVIHPTDKDKVATAPTTLPVPEGERASDLVRTRTKVC